jgi:hypothetical protein
MAMLNNQRVYNMGITCGNQKWLGSPELSSEGLVRKIIEHHGESARHV